MAGDFLLAFLGVGKGKEPAPAITAPAGWALITRVDHKAAAVRERSGAILAYGHTVGTSEAAAYTWTAPSPGVLHASAIAAYAGVDSAAPVDIMAAGDLGAGQSFVLPPLTTAGPGEMVVGAVTASPARMRYADTTWTGFGSARASVQNPGRSRSTAVFDELVVNAGAVSPSSVTASGPQDFALGAAIALRPCR